MDYGFGKTYTLPNKFTALNGCVQYYTVVFTNVVVDKTQSALNTDAKKSRSRSKLIKSFRSFKNIWWSANYHRC